MPQFLLNTGAEPGQSISLPSEEAHHLRDVLHLKVGEKIRLVDREGFSYLAKILTVTKSDVIVSILQKNRPGLSPSPLQIGQALLKGEKMESVLQKSVELGVAVFHPLITSRTVVRLKSTEKIQRWQKIVDAATKQCGRTDRMILKEAVTLERFLEEAQASRKIIFWEEGGRPLKNFFSGANPAGVVIGLVGPEGGFSADEVEKAKKEGFEAASLGPRILRAETAALVAATLIQYELGNL